MQLQRVVKGNLRLLPTAATAENAPFANQSRCALRFLRSFEIASITSPRLLQTGAGLKFLILLNRRSSLFSRLARFTVRKRNGLVTVDLFSQRDTLGLDFVNCRIKCLVEVKIFNLCSQNMILAVENDPPSKLVLAALHNDLDGTCFEGGISKKCVQTVFNMLLDGRGNIKLTSGNSNAHIHLQIFSGLKRNRFPEHPFRHIEPAFFPGLPCGQAALSQAV